MNRLPSSCPPTGNGWLATSPNPSATGQAGQGQDGHTDATPCAWHDLLVETWARHSARLDQIDASLSCASPLDRQRLDRTFHGCQILLCEAVRDGRFADRDLVWSRGAVLFRAGLRRQALPPSQDPASIPELLSKRAWLREFRSLIDLALRERNPRLPPPRATRQGPHSLTGTSPDNFVFAVREQTAHLRVLKRGGPEQSLHQPGHPQLHRALQILQGLHSAEVRDPDALPRWQAALREVIGLEDEALATAREHHAQPSETIRHLMAHRRAS